MYEKRQKKLKSYKVCFHKEWESDHVIPQAETDYEINAVAREYFRNNADSIEFKEKPRGRWAGETLGYDSISYVKVR